MSASPLITAQPALSRSDWKRLNRLLAQALEVDASARAGWIASLPDSDRDLLPVLEQLLDRAESTEAMAATRAGPGLGSDSLRREDTTTRSAPVEEEPGSQIGPYRLLREIGRGGMGTVWLAARTDGTFKRQVALKLPRAEWTDRGLAERMARERAVLASLNHPNIAQLYDAGWASDGRPYLALEYVEGEAIDSWCRRQQLAIAARVRLFVTAIRAVAYAHAKLVIHRDIKPSNVLVAADGSVKLLDFGIAKLLASDQRQASETELTQLSGRALTLNYAAPEQILGQPVSTAADTYSLGVMLFELLTGERPYRLAGESRGALEDAIVNVEPPLPSSVAADKAAARALRGDLDTIIRKTLKKAPSERYESAVSFADDLERYLAQQPVSARPDSRRYRARTFIRRNRLALGAAGGFAATLLLGATFALWQAHTARQEATRAGVIKEFVLSMIRQADPMSGAASREADVALLTAAEMRIENEMNGQPEVAIELRLAIADAYANRGLIDRARTTLQSAIREGQKTLDGDDPRLAHARIKVAQNFVWLDDDVVNGLDGLDLGIQVARSLGSRGYRVLVEGLLNRGGLQWRNPLKREQDLREAYELAQRVFGPSDVLTLEAACLLAWPSEMNLNRLQLIEEAYRAGRADPKVGETHPVLLRAQVIYGYHLSKSGRVDDGVSLIHSAIETARKHHGEGQPTEDVLMAAQLAYWEAGQPGAALEAGRESLRLAEARVPHTNPIVRSRARNVLTSMLLNRQLAGADVVLGKLGNMLDDTTRYPGGQVLRGTLLLLQGSAVEAEAILKEAVEGVERNSRERFLAPRLFWAWALRENGKPDRAIAVLQSVDPTGFVWDEDRYVLLNQLGAAHLELGDAEAALRFASEAVAAVNATKPDTPDAADSFLIHGRALVRLGRTGEALKSLEASDAFWRRFDPDNAWAAEAAHWHGYALAANGETRRGRAMMDAARPVLQKSPMPSHRALAAASS